MTEIRTSVAVPFSEIYRAITNTANPAPYLRDGTSEWLHFQVVAAATPRVKTTHVSFRSHIPLLRYASFKYTHFLMHEVGPFLISAHIFEWYSRTVVKVRARVWPRGVITNHWV